MSPQTREALADKRRQQQNAGTTSTDVATPDAPQPTIAQFLNNNKLKIARALPNSIDPDRFMQIIVNEIRRNPELGKCTMQSLLGAVLLCAQLGLYPGPLGHAYLVPYKNKGVPEVQFQLGYKGIVSLARRSGELVSIVAHPVRDGDVFEWEYGLDEKLVHKPALDGGGKTLCYYGVAHFKDGGHAIQVLSVADVEGYRKRAQSQKHGVSGAWATDYDQMGCKTVIRRMAPYLPLSVEAARGIEADGGVTNISPDDLGDLVTTPESELIDLDSEEVDPENANQEGAAAEGSASGGDAGETGDGADGQDVGRTEPEAAPASDKPTEDPPAEVMFSCANNHDFKRRPDQVGEPCPTCGDQLLVKAETRKGRS